MAYPSGYTASEMTLKIDTGTMPGVSADAITDADPNTQRAYSVTAAAFPDFRFNTEERNAGGYITEVDTLLPVQELTFSVNVFDERLFRAEMRDYQRLGAVTDGTTVAALDAGKPQFIFTTTITRQEDAHRKLFEQTYRGRLVSALQSGFTPDGLQTFDVIVRPCYYFQSMASVWTSGDAQTAPAKTQVKLVDLLKGKYIVNGLDRWAARKKTLGL